MAKSFRDRNPYAVGIVSVTVLLSIVGAAFAYSVFKSSFTHPYVVRAVFNDAAGVRAGDNVKMAGINIGVVRGIEADRTHGNIVVRMEIEKGVRLAADSKAEIALETLLGTKAVRFTGPVHEPLLSSLPEGQRVIPIERTKTPVDVFDLAGTATRNIEATDTDQLNRLITQLADITQGKQESIRTLLTGIEQVSGALNSRYAQLRTLLDRGDQLTGELAAKDQTLVALIDRSQQVLDLVNSNRNDIAALLKDNNAAVGEIARILNVDTDELDAILNGLHPTLDVVSKDQGELDKALSILGPDANGLAVSVAHGPWQDVFIQAIGPDIAALLRGLVKDTKLPGSDVVGCTIGSLIGAPACATNPLPAPMSTVPAP